MDFQAGRLLKILKEEVGFDLSLKGLAGFMQIERRPVVWVPQQDSRRTLRSN